MKDGQVVRNNARLDFKGYSHKEGIDYDDTSAPVARIESVRLFFSYVVHKNYKVY